MESLYKINSTVHLFINKHGNAGWEPNDSRNRTNRIKSGSSALVSESKINRKGEESVFHSLVMHLWPNSWDPSQLTEISWDSNLGSEAASLWVTRLGSTIKHAGKTADNQTGNTHSLQERYHDCKKNILTIFSLEEDRRSRGRDEEIPNWDEQATRIVWLDSSTRTGRPKRRWAENCSAHWT